MKLLPELPARPGKFNIVIAFADSRLAGEKLAKKDCGQVAGVYFFYGTGSCWIAG